MNKLIQIRRALTGDIPLLAALGRKTFHDAFAKHNTRENMDLFLEAQFTREVLEAEMNEQGAAFFLACLEALPVGFTKVRTGYEPSELRTGLTLEGPISDGALEVERIYVLEDYQDQKIGTAFMDHNMSYARDQGYELIWLGVWEKNIAAIRFYERLGFQVFGSHEFILGKDIQTDVLMRRRV